MGVARAPEERGGADPGCVAAQRFAVVVSPAAEVTYRYVRRAFREA